MSEIRTGIYPGTFDPVTNGHVDIISRAAKVVDRLIIGIAANDGKDPMFSLEERMAMMTEEISVMDGEAADRITVKTFGSLLVDFAEAEEACVIIRGLRAVSDFEYEFLMAAMNSRLNSRVETMFLMASDRYQFISSRFVKEIGRLGGDIGKFVSAPVKERLLKRFAEDNKAAQ